MSQRAKRSTAALVVLAMAVACGAGIAFFAASPRSGAAGAQALPDTGQFRVGSVLGEERAGFSGRAKLQVFTSADAPGWPELASCLQAPAVSAAMERFTGILLDEKAEPEVESVLRERDGLRVVARSLNGAFLGGLKAGFTCDELLAFLQRLGASAASASERSPIYASLLESPAAVDALLQGGDGAVADKLVDLLEELEGSTSPAVLAAKSRLGK